MARKEKKVSEFYQRAASSIDEGIKAEKAGRKLTRHTINIPDPPKGMTAKQIIKLRKKDLKVSQYIFAAMLNVSPRTVQAWERDANQPNGSSLRLLHIAQKNPKEFLTMISP